MAVTPISKAKPPPPGVIGGVTNVATTFGMGGGGSWGQFIQEGEHVPELLWPQSIQWYERMLHSDSQVEALYQSTVLPITDYLWALDPNGADPAGVEALAADLGLPIGLPAADPAAEQDFGILPGRYSFDFQEHLTEALLALPLGHYYFEVEAEYDPADGLVHLIDLGPRAPSTIMQINVNTDGTLHSIRQHLVTTASPVSGNNPWIGNPEIGADKLVPYVWRGDARAKWLGRPMLRSMYRHWLVKDTLIRVDAINHERAGGVPWIKTDHQYEGAQPDLDNLAALAQQFRVGEDGGAALPPGAELVLARAGNTNVIASVNYHDEAMSRVWQQMVMQLGQTHSGARSLGQTFLDIQQAAQRAMANWFRGSFRQNLIERWWSWNVGTDERGNATQHPLLVCRPRTPPPLPPTLPPGGGGGGDFQASRGSPDPVRPTRAGGGPQSGSRDAAGKGPDVGPLGRGGVGDRGGDSGPDAEAGRALAAQKFPVAIRAAGESATVLPDRPLRRKPYEQELRAAVDFARIDAAYISAGTQLQAAFLNLWLPEQRQAVRDAIMGGTLGAEELAQIAVPVVGVDVLTDVLHGVAVDGAQAAAQELQAQGHRAVAVDAEALLGPVADHAGAVGQQIADGLSLAASRKAVQLAGGSLNHDEVAAGVDSYLAGLKHQWEADQLRGAVQMAENTGRFSVFSQADPGTSFYASGVLDGATCVPCIGEDGTQFASIFDASRDYSSGGYNDCLGGPRCRGTVVAVSGSEGSRTVDEGVV